MIAVPVEVLADTSHIAIPILFTEELENQGHLFRANPPHFSPLSHSRHHQCLCCWQPEHCRTPVVSRVEMLKGRKAQTSLCFLKDHSQQHPEHYFHSTMSANKEGKILHKITQNLCINEMSLFIFSSPNYYEVIELYQNQKGIHSLLWKMTYS